MKRIVGKIVRTIGYFIGFSVLLYPSVSKYVNQLHGTAVVSDYQQKVSHASEDQENQMFAEAQAYNERLLGTSGLEDPFSGEVKPKNPEYDALLNMNGDGMMGYIEIPAIKVLLPIYHGTSESVLQVGVGHLEQTSLPVGGASTHVALSGHRGLPNARLFTDLDQMVIGDVFYIKVLNRTLAYQVDQILTVLPDETEALEITPGADQVTLITCTPYAINTHRLLVRGTRIPYEEAVEVADELEIKPQVNLTQQLLMMGICAVLIIWVIVTSIRIMRWMKRRKKAEETDIEE